MTGVTAASKACTIADAPVTIVAQEKRQGARSA